MTVSLIFDFAAADGTSQRICLRDPATVVVARTLAEVRPALRQVQAAVAAGQYAAGYLCYEAAPAFDPAYEVREVDTELPLVWFGLFDRPSEEQPGANGSFSFSAWEPTIERATYDAGIAAIRAAIEQGITYQVNYTLRLRAQFAGDDRAFYEQLRAAQQSAYCAYLDLGRYRILSASPELFFEQQGDQLWTRPMKGTVRRGRWPAEDAALAAWLAQSTKNLAENRMILDLLRNDVGRIAQPGSVQVPSLFALEQYRTVWQLTSTVAASLPPATPLETVLSALFPCGSITGAPKISTMQQIAALETTPRNIYCGTLGLITPDGRACFSVAIRTVLLDTATGIAEYGTGGGITWDSTADDEYAEACLKAALLTEPWPQFELLETLRLEPSGYTLLEQHLARLAASAAYFGRPLDLALVRTNLASHAQAWPDALRRVRLLVDADGLPRVESYPLDAATFEQPQPVALAGTPISTHNRWLYHKTTYRPMYISARQAHPDAYDVLLWNEAGELTEFTNGNLVIERDGRLLTPPVASGLLAGTLRAALLAEGRLHEASLTRADLAQASRIWLINSVRGWVLVTLEV